MKYHSLSEKFWRGMIVAMLLLVTLAMLIPVWHVIMYSFSEGSKAIGGGLYWFPRGFSLQGYKVVLRDPLIGSAYLNTIFVTAAGTTVNLIMTFLAAYPLTRRDLRGRKVIQYMIFFTMLFNGGIVPTYLIVRAVGLVDSLWALIVPTAVSTYNIFVMRNFIDTIPENLFEAARIDGAGEFYILFQIVVPLSKAAMAVLGLMYAVGHWNSWFNCIIYINDTQKYTLSPILRQILFTMGSNNYYGYDPDLAAASMPVISQMCVVVVATAPILSIYPFLQKYFIKGVMLGAVKG